ncbi:zinc finger protein 711-like [Dermacentor andersoni]|uniref:zinc finger protein 711-like n=1 Tax=Dermacentor andersoni TaxID=34620 RepID=UPI00215555F7|nr:zinc finger protein 26-like [Dermacentor andersoni]
MASEERSTLKAAAKAHGAPSISCDQSQLSVLPPERGASMSTTSTQSQLASPNSTAEAQPPPAPSRPSLGAVAVVSSLPTHEPQLWYCCPHCERMCPNRNTLAVHVRIHMEDTPFKCALCHAAFTTKSFLIDHVKKHSTMKTLTCDVCFQPNCAKHDIRLHLRRRQTGPRPFRSDHRNKAFAVYTGLAGPKDTRPDGSANVCEACGATFACRSDLQKHFLTMHGNSKSNTGDNHGNTPKLPQGYNQMQGNPKLHMCHLCPARFTRNYSLVVHLRTHADDRQHGCDQCAKRFVTVSRLREHIRAAHSPQPTFGCKYCPIKCTWRSSLTYHVKKCHPTAGKA